MVMQPKQTQLLDNMSDTTETISELDQKLNLNGVDFPLVRVDIPERTRKTASGEKTVKGKVYIRLAALTAHSAVTYLSAVLALAEKANAGDGAKLAEKILGRHITNAYEDALQVQPNGEVVFSVVEYGKAQYALRRAKSSATMDELKGQQTLLLEQLIALTDLREAWRTDAVGLATDSATGEPIGHPWTAERWATECDRINSKERLGMSVSFSSFQELTVFIFNLRDRRTAVEKEMAERNARATAAAAKRQEKKQHANAPVDGAPSGQV